MIGRGRIVLVLILFAATWYVLQVTSGVKKVALKQELGTFPRTIASYHFKGSFQSSAQVVKLLGVDDYIHYSYADQSGFIINLYAGFYGAVGVTGGYHSPKNCLPGGGWGIDDVKRVVLHSGIGGKKRSTVSEMIIRSGDKYQVVLYWYQNRGRIIASEYMEKIFLVFDAVVKGRRDGTFVRITAPVVGGRLQESERRLYRFAEHVMVELENYLPGARL